MRVKVYTNSGNSTGGFTFNGGTLTGALTLYGNPSEDLEAAAKQYLDSLLVNLNADGVNNGILPAARLPSFAGDLVKPAGSATINLAPSGVTAGDYIKPTVNDKGLVTGGGALVEADIPSLDWSKIITGKPTTLGGFGITDGLSTSGGTLTGFITFNGSIIGNLQAVTKQYIDTTLSSATGIAIGDIIRKPTSITPTGFLKCNGGEVSKSTYNALYSVIGDRFKQGMQPGAGQPWKQQYTINEIQDGDITTWMYDSASNLPTTLFSNMVIVTKNRVYSIGGNNLTTEVTTVYTATINTDGTLGAWTTGTSLPGGLGYSVPIITKNRVYLLGGWIANTAVSTVYTAPINSDGTLGTWTTGTALPSIIYYAFGFVTKNRVYLCGGYNNSSWVNTVYTAPINNDGTLGTWSVTNSLPIAMGNTTPVITKNRVYICGGYNGSSLSTVYSAIINSDGTIGLWVTETNLPRPRNVPSVFISKNRVYLIGGYHETLQTSDVLSAPINADGSLGTWGTLTSLPEAAYWSNNNIIATKNYLYIIGACWNGSYVNKTYRASISGGYNDYSPFYKDTISETNILTAGSGKPWQQQYQINEVQSSDITGWVATTNFPISLTSAMCFVTKNKVYMLGGYNGTTWSSAVYSATINGDGTLGTWTLGTALPSSLGHSSAIVTKNRVYVIGGWIGSAVSTVYTAPINSDGTIGTWTTGPSLVTAVYDTQIVITKNKLYVLGGYTGSGPTATVQIATINIDGTISSWTTSSPLPVTYGYTQAIVTKNRIYLCGGYNGSYVATVYTASINSDGYIGSWSLTTSLPSAMSGSPFIVTKNRVYLLSGYNGSAWSTTVYTAPINSDGTLGNWTTGTSLPVVQGYGCAITTNGRVYIITGGQGSTPSANIYVASISGGLNDYSSYYTPDTTNYMMPGSGRPWQQQYQINTTQSNDITGWTTGTALPTAFTGNTIVTKNRVYLCGGFNGSSYVSTVYTAPINGDGTLGAWTTDTALPGANGGAQAVVTKNRVYLIGGNNGSPISTVYTAPINADGTLGTWTTDTALPIAVQSSQVILTKKRVYLLGGSNASGLSTVYTATVNENGTINTWTLDSPLPGILYTSQAVVTKNRVYLIGGSTGSGPVSTVYTAPINSDGTLGTWTTSTSLPSNVNESSVIVTKDKVYLLGGHVSGITYSSIVYMAIINADGTLGTWTTGTALPGVIGASKSIITNNRVYLLGGYNGSSWLSTVYTATISGGLNDYSPYYDGTVVAIDNPLDPIDTSLTFALPDLSSNEKFDSISYIKY